MLLADGPVIQLFFSASL